MADIVAWLPRWLIAVCLIALTALGAGLMFSVFRPVAARLFKIRFPGIFAVLERAATLLQFALMLAAVALVLPLLPLDPPVAAILNKVTVAGVIIFVGWTAILASDIFLERYMRRFRVDESNNLQARKAVTQIRVLKRTAQVLLIIVTAGFALMTFDSVRQYGVSLFASAGVAGLAIGLAARPLLSNLIAGVQIALSQPIRIDDAVVVEGEWGWIEELTATYVVIRLWDWRRLVVPLGYFLEHPFQNWTRTTASLIGTVFFHLDHRTPVAVVRSKLEELAKASALWNGEVVNLQVTECTERTIELRALVSAANSGAAFDLRCEIREKMLAFLQAEIPEALPRLRGEITPAADARDGMRIGG